MAVPAGVKAGAHLQTLQTAALISEEKQMQLLQQEQKWEQLLPSNPFQTILWIHELVAEVYGQIQVFRGKIILLAFLTSDAAPQSKTHH